MQLSRIHLVALCCAFPVAFAIPAFAATPVDSLHCNDSTGVSLMKGRTVTVSGVVIGQFSSQRNARIYLDYGTGAVNVFGSPKNCAVVGDSVRVTGVVANYGGLTEITGTEAAPVTIDSLGKARVPAPRALTLAQIGATEQGGCEPNESRLVAIDDVRIRSADGDALSDSATFATNTNYRLVGTGQDTTSFVMMRVTDPEGCDPSRTLEGQRIPTGPVRVAGILSQFMGRSRTHGGYQILPRGRDDVQAMTAKAAKPAKQ